MKSNRPILSQHGIDFSTAISVDSVNGTPDELSFFTDSMKIESQTHKMVWVKRNLKDAIPCLLTWTLC